MTLLDPIGASLSLTATVLFARANIAAWPVSLAAIAVNSVLFFERAIYGDMFLQAVYLVLMLYGWYWWLNKNNQKSDENTKRPVTIGKRSLILSEMLCMILSSIGISWLLRYYTNTDVATWDAICTGLSLWGQWLTCRKRLECWVVWFTVDALYFALYLYKGIPFHAANMAIYLGLAIYGWIRWRQLQSEQIQSQLRWTGEQNIQSTI
jgi:nicotinamide mononucleotide transporter